MRKLASVLIVGGIVLLVTPGVALAAEVETADFKFVPKSISVDPGETITFTNTGSVVHTATADNGSFDTGDIAPGDSKSITIDSAGTYGYYCVYHGSPGTGMAGTIRVGSGAGGTVPQTASPLAWIGVAGGIALLLGLLLSRRRSAPSS